jgi:hypothetical protein
MVSETGASMSLKRVTDGGRHDHLNVQERRPHSIAKTVRLLTNVRSNELLVLSMRIGFAGDSS